jgi:hypothetical protein
MWHSHRHIFAGTTPAFSPGEINWTRDERKLLRVQHDLTANHFSTARDSSL